MIRDADIIDGGVSTTIMMALISAFTWLMMVSMMMTMMMSWIIAASVGNNPSQCLLPCPKINSTSGDTIQLIPKHLFQKNESNHVTLFGSSTLMLFCKIPNCLSSPCKNQGTCLETDYSYECLCTEGYCGDNCERRVRLCADLKEPNSTGTFRIDPDGQNGNISDFVQVECRNGVTVIPHDIIGEQAVPRGYERLGSYQRNVVYTLPLDIIVAIINNARSCRQYVRATCNNVFIVKGNRQNIYWISRQGTIMRNWGDAPSHVRGCICGLNNTCYNTGSYCNCDDSVGNSAPLTDEGFLTDRTRLPVIRLHFGDTGGPDEKIYYELGFLECE
ncbi:contactin-associated protein-like 2 [Lytechinus variegatus]|uniref:contactin-associated protein-like 2 n=1 Tax=Lytechinus variegatus TaxID=7654 RepID=UPI001BB2C3CF|nr:contactin-associated protein-like 2 [Lytechinus variegatus]